ncbi:MAG: ABC transporter ATP-binding protein [Anaerolineae bacterium]
MAIVQVEHLKKYYGKARGVEDVNFEINEGEIFGFIGPNGAGKSTTIRTMLALIHPTSGSASIFGLDCLKHAPEIAREVGYLPSEVFYYENMRAGELLRYSASFYKKDCSKRIRELSEALELDLTRKIDDLSFGNRKKVGIIQGLIHEPRLIILDEPSIGLDPLMQQRFFNILQQENQRGATILFSSHILSEVQKICSRVAIIKEGRIIHEEKMATFRENSYKKVTLEANGQLNPEVLAFDGVTDLVTNGRGTEFIYRGNVNSLVQRLSALDLLNLSIGEPDLEEIFMHYYQ